MRNLSFTSALKRIYTAPGGSRRLDFFSDVDDFRTNLSTKWH